MHSLVPCVLYEFEFQVKKPAMAVANEEDITSPEVALHTIHFSMPSCTCRSCSISLEVSLTNFRRAVAVRVVA